MNCPVLRELELQEARAENEQARVMTGREYDIAAIRDCGEHCTMAAVIYAQRLQIQALEQKWNKLRTATITYLAATTLGAESAMMAFAELIDATGGRHINEAEAAAAKGEK